MRLGNRELRVAVIVATGFIGCAGGAAPDSGEKIGEALQEWSTESCAAAVANEAFDGAIPPLTSPATYDTCQKNYVVDLRDLLPIATPGTGGSASTLELKWGSPNSPITPQEACEKSWVGGTLFYKSQNDGWLAQGGQVIDHGDSVGLDCVGRKVLLGPLAPGGTYRLVATARTASDATRKISIRTLP